jgi:hypothetical protein
LHAASLRRICAVKKIRAMTRCGVVSIRRRSLSDIQPAPSGSHCTLTVTLQSAGPYSEARSNIVSVRRFVGGRRSDGAGIDSRITVLLPN